MLLLIDAGNTRIKWALANIVVAARHDIGQWLASGVVDNDAFLQLADAWRGQPVARVILSNVAGHKMRDNLQRVLQAAFGNALVPEWFSATTSLLGVQNGYREPTQLGCDRFASLIGAYSLFPQEPLIVVTCGTATTIDALTSDGMFPGGLILPGLSLMTTSLATHAVQLPSVHLHTSATSFFADNTEDAIISACLSAQAALIEKAIVEHARPSSAVRCVISGGAAKKIASRLSIDYTEIPFLTLLGLHAVASGRISGG